MRGGAAGRRRATEAVGGQLGNSRDSDASFASSRPSSIGIGRPSVAGDVYSVKTSAIRAINAFLSSRSFHVTFPTHSVPSMKDICETLKFFLSELDFPYDAAKWDDDFVILLKTLNCPFKLTKSTIRSPNNPHNWPTVLALIHWLVQLARYSHHLSINSSSFLEANSLTRYAFDSYRHYIEGEDDLVDVLEADFLDKLEREKNRVAEEVTASEKTAVDLEAKLEELMKGPSPKEALEKAKADLEADANKFHAIIGEFTARNAEIDKVLKEKDEELKAKVEERQRICEENEELKKTVERQSFNSRDADRTKRELQAVERDITEAEVARDAWEQKGWDLNTQIRNQFHELQSLAMESNHALRRLKFDIQYTLNEKGSTSTEVMGVDYKAIVKPALESLADGINKSSMSRLEEQIALQHESSEMASKIEAKKNQLALLQSQINEVEEKMKLVSKEIQDHSAKCDMEVKMMKESVREEAHNLEVVEKEAAEMLKASEQRLEEAVKRTEEETQACAGELFALIDSVSKQKEYMDSKISEMKRGVADTARAVSDVYKENLQRHLV